jgi:hypothetical protein
MRWMALVLALSAGVALAQSPSPAPSTSTDDGERPLVHGSSGAVFPGRTAGFLRVADRVYDDPALGISVQYLGRDLFVHVYVYPVDKGATFDGHFEQAKQDVLTHRKAAKFLRAVETPRSGRDGTVPGRLARFELEAEPPGLERVRAGYPDLRVPSFLWLFRKGGWWVKIRATITRKPARPIMDLMVDFIESLGFPTR